MLLLHQERVGQAHMGERCLPPPQRQGGWAAVGDRVGTAWRASLADIGGHEEDLHKQSVFATASR